MIINLKNIATKDRTHHIPDFFSYNNFYLKYMQPIYFKNGNAAQEMECMKDDSMILLLLRSEFFKAMYSDNESAEKLKQLYNNSYSKCFTFEGNPGLRQYADSYSTVYDLPFKETALKAYCYFADEVYLKKRNVETSILFKDLLCTLNDVNKLTDEDLKNECMWYLADIVAQNAQVHPAFIKAIFNIIINKDDVRTNSFYYQKYLNGYQYSIDGVPQQLPPISEILTAADNFLGNEAELNTYKADYQKRWTGFLNYMSPGQPDKYYMGVVRCQKSSVFLINSLASGIHQEELKKSIEGYKGKHTDQDLKFTYISTFYYIAYSIILRQQIAEIKKNEKSSFREIGELLAQNAEPFLKERIKERNGMLTYLFLNKGFSVI